MTMLRALRKRPYIYFILPGFVIYSLLVIYPIFAAVGISLYKWNGISPKVFVGLQNYVQLFSDTTLVSQFIKALSNSLILFVLTTCIQIPLQIFVAYTIYNKVKGSRFFKVAIFSPQFISTPVIVFMFSLILDANFGVFNKAMQKLGFTSLVKPWMGLPEYGIFIVYGMLSWAGIGVGMILFLGAMNMISKETIESSYMDGAGYWRRLLYIVIPQIRVTILNLVLLSYIFSLTIFDFSYILGGVSGGVNQSVDVMSLFFYRVAFGDNNPIGGSHGENTMGMGTTIAVVLFALIFVLALIQVLYTYRHKKEG